MKSKDRRVQIFNMLTPKQQLAMHRFWDNDSSSLWSHMMILIDGRVAKKMVQWGLIEPVKSKGYYKLTQYGNAVLMTIKRVK